MKRLNKYLAYFGAFFVAATLAIAQKPPTSSQTQEANLQAYISMLRQDLKKGKVAILTDLMALGPDQAAKFWPVYNEYDKSLTKLSDERIAFIRLYVDSYPKTSDETATTIATGIMDLEAKRIALRKDYFQRISGILTPKDAFRWLQIEAQIERIVDLQILSSLPIVE